jgi:two-component system response regulator MprA
MTEPRVLVVEDDAALRDLLGRGLREEGFAVVTVRDAAGAMRLAGLDCAALILDVGLPTPRRRSSRGAVRRWVTPAGRARADR